MGCISFSRLVPLFVFSSATLLAQSAGSLTGQVTDASQASIPPAKVLVENVATGQRREAARNTARRPAGGFNQDFIGRAGLYPIGVCSARGYAVLRPNPRGSTGYGKEFRYANIS